MIRRIVYYITTEDQPYARTTETYGAFRRWQQAALRTNRPFTCWRTVEDIQNDQAPAGSQSLPARPPI